jgi:peptidoglycan/xylan/chitin deacetylase (PgdA/CDA1 family)
MRNLPPASLIPALFLLSAAPSLAAQSPIELALTVDDLPVHMSKPDTVSRTEILRGFIQAFAKTGLQGVWGFVNAKGLGEDPSSRAGMEEWRAAGHHLGNHTFSHADLVGLSVPGYLSELSRDEPALLELSRGDDFHQFRYPYLSEGDTLAKRDGVRQALASLGYRVAEVTVDFGDWAWNDPYTRCLAKGDLQTISWMEKAYFEAALDRLRLSDEWARDLFGRPIRQILLLHAGVFGSRMIERLIAAYRNEGVRFVSLEEAEGDPIYSTDPRVVNQGGTTFLRLWGQAKGVQAPRPSPVPLAELEAACR